ncbi:hypothetical protein ACFX15_027462 [Malus domestica]
MRVSPSRLSIRPETLHQRQPQNFLCVANQDSEQNFDGGVLIWRQRAKKMFGSWVSTEKKDGDEKHQGLEVNTGIEVMKRNAASVAIAGFGDGKPRVPHVEFGEVAHLLQVSFHVDQHQLHGRPDGAEEPRRDE